MDFKINKGYEIKLTGKSAQTVSEYSSDLVGLCPADFRYVKPRLLLKEGDSVKRGTAFLCDKSHEEVQFVSPVSGKIQSIVRGDRRSLLQVTISCEGDEAEEFEKFSSEKIQTLSREEALSLLSPRGLWPCIRRRPYDRVALAEDKPSSIFINGIDSSPLGSDLSVILKGRAEDFQAGVNLLSRLSEKVHLCLDGEGDSASLLSSTKNCQVHTFSGLHPRGNLSVHIERLDPVVDSEKVIWYLRAEDVAVIGKTLTSGTYDAERVFAWAGPKAAERSYFRSVQGACLKNLPKESGEDIRLITGSILSGRQVDSNGFLGFYDSTVIALDEGRKRGLMGWLKPGASQLSYSKTFLSALNPGAEYVADTASHGGHRAIIDSEMYDRVQPLDIPTIFLYKSLLAGDIEEAERLGLWSVASEDFALASFICPSKNDFGEVVQKTFDELYKESH